MKNWSSIEYEFEPRKVSTNCRRKGCVTQTEESDLFTDTPFVFNRTFRPYSIADGIENEWDMQ